MKIDELIEAGVGKITAYNTTVDVKPGETERQAKKLFPMNKDGKPKQLRGSSTHKAFNLGLVESELTIVQRAEQFAQQAHKDHKRKYTGEPYYVHLDEVRRIVKGAGGSEDMQAAALLHDTVEDTSVTSQDIMKEFGAKITKLVAELTDISKPEDGNRATRKAMDRDKLASASPAAQTIKYADLISNGKDIMQNDPKFAKVYMKEKAELLRVMTKGDSRLRDAALAMLPDEVKENMSVTGTERRRLEKKKGLEIGSPAWFKHWFDLPYLREDISTVDLQQLETFADKLFGKVGIDVEFTRHFLDRVNDVRNQKPITMSELTRLFKQEYKRWGKPIAQMGPDQEAVMKDLQTDINLPFALRWDEQNQELDLIAKTIMRKKGFRTPNQEFPVETAPSTNKPGTIGQHINWGGKNQPEKPKSNISIARRKQPEPQNWWQQMLAKGKNLFDDQEVEEEGPFGVLARKAGHMINKSQYEKAAEFLHKILKRKYDETGGNLRHTLGYYASMLARQTGNKINWRELEQEYLNMYGNTMFENFADGKKKGKSRPGRVKRAGASCKGSVSELRKKAKNSSGEKQKMYHWCANMKAGKKK